MVFDFIISQVEDVPAMTTGRRQENPIGYGMETDEVKGHREMYQVESLDGYPLKGNPPRFRLIQD